MSFSKILVVDDDQNLLRLLRMRLESEGYEVKGVTGGTEAVDSVRAEVFDLSIMDLRLAERDGISLMEEIHLIQPQMPVIILTAHGSIDSAVEAMRRGAYSYATKPFEGGDLLLQIERALENRRLMLEVKRLTRLLEDRYDFANIVGRSEKMQRVLEVVSRIAHTDSTVYLHGESGTGKELIAKAIHLASERSGGEFVAINCAAIPETLLESELFGHEKGAFTGAVRSTKGLFTQAHGGTILLDEIGDMPLSTQAKVLRVLEERQFYSVGGKRAVEVDVRVIVATNKDLEEEVKKGSFREDLFYRIHVIPIHIPPLRERKAEIPALVKHFLKKIGEQMKKEVKGVAPGGMQRLMMYDWPGNVRELEHTLEYAMALAQHDVIEEEYILPAKFPKEEPLKPLKEARDAFEKEYLTHLLEMTEGHVSRAAELAGKYRADFYDLLKKHDLKVSDYKKSGPRRSDGEL